MASSFANRIFFASDRATTGSYEPATTCKVCFDTGADYDFGGPCPKGCAAPETVAAEPIEAPALAPVVAGPARKVAAAPAPYVVAIRPAARTPERRAFDLAYAAELARCIQDDEPEVRRESSQAPGVTLIRRGRVITVEWFAGNAIKRNVYFIHQGKAVIVDAPLRGTMPRAAVAHVERTLAAYAARLDGKVAA